MSAARTAFVLALALFGALLLRHHWTIVTMPIPLDLYEGTMPLITGIIASGANPYTAAYQPQAADVYPPLYNILVAPLTHVFANELVLHRAVSALFIVLACAVFWYATWRGARSALLAWAAALAVYAGLVFYSTPVASTNALGVFLFSLSVVVPWARRFSVRSLVAAGACGLLAFYAKQYFILGVAIVCLYTFLYVSAARALALGAGFAAAVLASLALVHWSSPYFLDNTLFSSSIAIRALQQWSMARMQLVEFARIYGAYLAIALLAAAGALRAGGLRAAGARLRARCAPRGWSWHAPLLAQPVDYFRFAFFWATVAVTLTIGQNPGNYMTYLFQLMSPFLLVAVFTGIGSVDAGAWRWLPLVLLGFYQQYTFLPRDFSYDARNWARMEELVRGADQVLATQMLLMMLLENGKEIHQDGHTFYFPLAASKPALFRQREPGARVEAVWSRYIADLYRRIEHGEFDLVIVSAWEVQGIFERHPPPGSALDGKAFLQKYYEVAETIPLSMTNRQGGGTWHLQVWRPRAHAAPLPSGTPRAGAVAPDA